MRPSRPSLLRGPRRRLDERLLWSRDIRFVHRLAATIVDSRVLELDSGAVLIAPAAALTDTAVTEGSAATRGQDYGLVSIDASLPEADRYLMALSAAVQASGL